MALRPDPSRPGGPTTKRQPSPEGLGSESPERGSARGAALISSSTKTGFVVGFCDDIHTPQERLKRLQIVEETLCTMRFEAPIRLRNLKPKTPQSELSVEDETVRSETRPIEARRAFRGCGKTQCRRYEWVGTGFSPYINPTKLSGL
jgi:hypothetical protein